jgi:hypothetical protein
MRAVPAKLIADNRIVINNHLKRTRGGKVSVTHLIGYAVGLDRRTHSQLPPLTEAGALASTGITLPGGRRTARITAMAAASTPP